MSSIIEKLGISTSPWKFVKGSNIHHIFNKDVLIIKTERDPEVLDRTWNRQTIDHQLIAAAPDMLEHLIYICVELEKDKKDVHLSIIETIEKATNKSWEEIKELLK